MAGDHRYSFGSLLKRYRRGMGITQQELAARAGYSAVYVGMLERGERLPSGATGEALADALALDSHQRDTLIMATQAPGRFRHDGKVAVIPAAKVARLVGRSREMTLLQQHLDDDEPAMLVLAGEPGIGKTRLLHEVIQYAQADGWNVLEGSSHLLSGQEPFTPVLGALERHLQRQSATTLQRHLEGCSWLVRLLPELAEVGSVPPSEWQLSPEQERRLMFKAVRRFLNNVAGPAGTLLVLDDLQWASLDALDLLAYLVRSPADVPLRVVGAYRSTEVRPEEPLGVVLTDLIRAGQATKIELGPLAGDEAKELLGRLLGESVGERDELVEQVVRRAGGMPLFLVSYAQVLRSMSVPSGSIVETIPRDVVEGMRQRAAALPEAARELLGVAAVLGRQAPRGLLMNVMTRQGRSEDSILTALEEACRVRLLVEQGEDGYEFSHDLVREAVIADLSTARRSLLHRNVAEAFEQGPRRPSAETLAYHYMQGGDLERAVRYLEHAGDHALALRANAEAAGVFCELATQLDTLDRAMEAAAAREKLGAVLMTAAQYDAALAALDRAADTYRTGGEVEGLVRVMARIGEVHALRGTAEEGIARLEPLLASLRDDGSSKHGMAALYVTLAWLINTTGRYTEALAMAERAAELASVAADSMLLLRANLRRGHLLLMLEQVDQGVAVLEEALPHAEEVGDLRGLRFAVNSLGWIHELRGNFEQDRAYTERAFMVAEQLDDPTVLAFMRSNRGGPAFNLGNWKQARVDFEAGLALMRQLSASWASAWPPLLLGQLCLAEGQRAQAEELLQEAITLAERNKDLEALRWARGTLAERDLLEGSPETVIGHLEPLLDRPGQREIDVCALLPLIARAHAEFGQVEQAWAMSDVAVARASAARMRPTLANALHARAMVAQRRGRWEQAQRELDQALALCRAMQHPYGEAKMLYAHGVLHMQQRDDDKARSYFEGAVDILARLGERLYAERVEILVADLSSHARRG